MLGKTNDCCELLAHSEDKTPLPSECFLASADAAAFRCCVSLPAVMAGDEVRSTSPPSLFGVDSDFLLWFEVVMLFMLAILCLASRWKFSFAKIMASGGRGGPSESWRSTW